MSTSHRDETLTTLARQICDFERREKYDAERGQRIREWDEAGGYITTDGMCEPPRDWYRLPGGKRTTNRTQAIRSWAGGEYRTADAMVDEHGAVLLYDEVAGYYTRGHSLTSTAESRIRGRVLREGEPA